MKKHTLVLVSTVLLGLTIGLFISPAPTQAIGKVTSTPASNSPENTQPDDLDVPQQLEQAFEKIQAQDYSGAIDDYNAIIARDQTVWEAYFFRGFAHAEVGDFDRAIDDYTRAISIQPYDWVSYSLRGNLYIQTEYLGQANLDFVQAIYLNPRYGQAYGGKALLDFRRGDQTTAEIYSGIFEALNAQESGSTPQAIDLVTALIDRYGDSNNPTVELGYAYYNRSNFYISNANWNDALDDINIAIDLQPEMQDYYMARGFIYSETGELSQAAPDFYQRMTLIETTRIDETIDFGQSVSIDMDYGVVARLTFDGEAGQTISITARDSLSVGVDPLLVLLDTDGNPIAGNDDGGSEFDSLINDYTLPATGTYTAVVSHANGGYVGTVNVSLK